MAKYRPTDTNGQELESGDYVKVALPKEMNQGAAAIGRIRCFVANEAGENRDAIVAYPHGTAAGISGVLDAVGVPCAECELVLHADGSEPENVLHVTATLAGTGEGVQIDAAGADGPAVRKPKTSG